MNINQYFCKLALSVCARWKLGMVGGGFSLFAYVLPRTDHMFTLLMLRAGYSCYCIQNLIFKYSIVFITLV